VISTRAKQTAYLLVFAEGILLSLAFSCAFTTRALVSLPSFGDGIGIDFNDHIWMLSIGIPLYWLLAWGKPNEGAQFRLTLPRHAGHPLRHSPLALVPEDAAEVVA